MAYIYANDPWSQSYSLWVYEWFAILGLHTMVHPSLCISVRVQAPGSCSACKVELISAVAEGGRGHEQGIQAHIVGPIRTRWGIDAHSGVYTHTVECARILWGTYKQWGTYMQCGTHVHSGVYTYKVGHTYIQWRIYVYNENLQAHSAVYTMLLSQYRP